MPKKILILDDNEDILELMKETLRIEGYEVEGLSYVDDIREAAISKKADLVILDYILFGINGGEFCHQLKNTLETEHIPVIMVSAYPRVLESLGNYGADAFIAKPFDIADVINTVNSLLVEGRGMAKVA